MSLLPVDDATSQLLASVETVAGKETVALTDTAGRILATDIISAHNVPPADNSAMDGYAFKRSDVTEAENTLAVSARIRAGDPPGSLIAGTTARIFTGAEVPEGADTVVMQENCTEKNGVLEIHQMPIEGANIRRAGQDIFSGSKILERGHKIHPQDVGLLASVGCHEAEVFSRLKIGVLSTGNELVEPGQKLEPGQIYNSNRFQLFALLEQAGFEVEDFGVLPDDYDATVQLMESAAKQVDGIISSGGVSAGEEDYVRKVLEQRGDLQFWKVAIKPGKPFSFGKLDKESGFTPYFGLPGNPVAVFVTYCLFVLPCLKKMQGQHVLAPVPEHLPVNFSWKASPKRQEYLRVRKAGTGLELYPNQSSGVLSSVSWADGLLEVRPGNDLEPGQGGPFYPFSGLLK